MNASAKPRPAPFWEDDPVSIKYYVKRFILQNRPRFAGKIAIDLPAGSGITSQQLHDAGAKVHAFDLFPEYFRPTGIRCQRANILEGLPVADGFADFVFCQEGIEHFSDQYRALQEFNRVLKKGGSLILTTPNYSNLMSRLSYFLFESEYVGKKMPPNEVDAIWMLNDPAQKEIYLGHYFLLGIQRLRGLAKLAGFRLKTIISTKVNKTSLAIFPFAYPFLLFTGWLTYRTYLRGTRGTLSASSRKLYRELMTLNTDRRVLLDKHLFVEFEKEAELRSVRENLRSQHRSFDITT
ncbi:MAG: class I SAM-dependent methyltransferase [Chthoniobacterales bacterium]